ncbi:MAG: hypothetical protein ACD_75C02402G0001 [uncultured bacterium]|nr:MAG: hypothetical protein ACD_75C02402G0001 [uncultured bacterium]
MVIFLDVVQKNRSSEEIVHRDVEESLDLTGVEIHRQNAFGPGLGDEIGDELGGDRCARRHFPVLAGIPVIGDDGRDTVRG